MTTGCHFKKLGVAKFGAENITRIIPFHRTTHFSSEEFVFEAIRSLIDPTYSNDKVTKPNYIGSDSKVALHCELNKVKYSVVRVFGQNGGLYLNKLEIARVPDWLISLNETCFMTPSALENETLSRLFSQRFQTEQILHGIVEHSRSIGDHNVTLFTLQERNLIKTVIEEDLKLHENLTQLKRQLILSYQNRTVYDGIERREIENLTPAIPSDEFDFRDALVNVHLASLQFGIAYNQREWIKRSMKTIDIEKECYRNFGNSAILSSNSWKKSIVALKEISESVQYTRALEEFYTTNIHICAQYTAGFVTANEWAREKECIEEMKAVEMQFFAELVDEVMSEDDRTAISEQIDASCNRVVELTFELDGNDQHVNNSRASVLHMFESYISYHVTVQLNEFCDGLCQSLNNPMLEVADFQSYIGGLFHYITNNAGADRMPEFIFDQAQSYEKRLFNLLQTYLAPLSYVQLAKTTDDALDFLETIPDELNDNCSETAYVFVPLDKIAQGKKPKKASSRVLSNIRRKFGYTDGLENLLSNLEITCDEKILVKNKNLLNLKTKRICLANRQTSFATESEYLFQLLQKIKEMYVNIGNVLLDAKHFAEEFIDSAEKLQSDLNDYHRVESLLRSELMNLRLLRFEELNIAHKERIIELLKQKSSNRSRIRDQLLLLQHKDSDPTFADTLNTLQNSDEVETNEADIWDKDDSHLFSACIGELLRQLTKFKSDLSDVHAVWQQTCEDLYIEPNDTLRDRLSTISAIDFIQYNRSIEDCLLRRKVPARYRRSNDLRRENILGQINGLLAQLHFPMGDPATLKECLRKLKLVMKTKTITENVIAMSGNILQSSEEISNALDALCAKLRSAIATMNDDPLYTVDCQLLHVGFDGTNWKRTSKDKTDSLAHFYASRLQIPEPQQDDIVAVLLYIYYVRLFTESPIILTQIPEICSDKHMIAKICELLKTDVADRFAIVYVGQELIDLIDPFNANEDAPQLDQHVNANEDAPQLDQNANANEDAPQLDQNANANQEAPQLDQNANANEDAPQLDQNANANEEAPLLDQNANANEDAPQLDHNANANEDAPQLDQNANANEDANRDEIMRRIGCNPS